MGLSSLTSAVPRRFLRAQGHSKRSQDGNQASAQTANLTWVKGLGFFGLEGIIKSELRRLSSALTSIRCRGHRDFSPCQTLSRLEFWFIYLVISHTEVVPSSDHHGALSAQSLRRQEPPTGLTAQAAGGSDEERRCIKTHTPVLFLETASGYGRDGIIHSYKDFCFDLEQLILSSYVSQFAGKINMQEC